MHKPAGKQTQQPITITMLKMLATIDSDPGSLEAGRDGGDGGGEGGDDGGGAGG